MYQPQFLPPPLLLSPLLESLWPGTGSYIVLSFLRLHCLTSLVYDHRGIGLSTSPAIQVPVVSVLGPGNSRHRQPQSQLPGTQDRSHQDSCPLWTEASGRASGSHTAYGTVRPPDSGLTFIALTLSDEEGTSLVHWSQQLPLSILPADGPEEPSGRQREWVSLRIGDTAPKSILRCSSHLVQLDAPKSLQPHSIPPPINF